MKFIKVTSLALKEGIDGNEDARQKTTSVISVDQIEQFYEHDLDKKIPIIGEGEKNRVKATSIMFRSGRSFGVIETPDQIVELIQSAK